MLISYMQALHTVYAKSIFPLFSEGGRRRRGVFPHKGIHPRIIHIHAKDGHISVNGIEKRQRVPVVLDVGQLAVLQLDASCNNWRNSMS